jgi:hypothetical protein
MKVRSKGYAKWLAAEAPHRLPQKTDFHSAIITARRKLNVSVSALAGIEVIMQGRPEGIIQ